MPTTTRQDYSPIHAGNVLLKQCEGMRATLRANLVKPAAGDAAALAAYIEAKVAIARMDYKELREKAREFVNCRVDGGRAKA